MEEIERIEHGSFKMKHFAKLHERIQTKYEEMQRKLEKSKSVDALPSLDEDFVYKDEKYASSLDIREIEVFGEVENDKHVMQNLVLEEENLHKNDAHFEYVEVKESSISESESSFLFIEKHENDDYGKYFGDELSNISLESLNEEAIESDGYHTPSTPPPQKISIRDRIGSRISAVKEKRRREEKERKALKERKKEYRDKVDKFILSNTTKQDIYKFKKIKIATVTIALIEVTGLDIDDSDEKSRILFCRFRLGSEKYKSKSIKSQSSSVKWQELFNFGMYEDNMLEVSLWDKDIFIGRSIINLFEVEKEKTHKMRLDLEDEVGNVRIFILLTISGSALVNTLFDLDDYQETQKRLSTVRKKYAWYYLLKDSKDVGWLSVIVYGAKGLFTHDTCCVLELDNERLQTCTETKTNEPNWMKIFTFAVTDITSVLEVTIHDDKRSEDIAKVTIPLLRIINGKKKWYALKDITKRDRAKGNNSRILLEMRITWSLVKASLRVINPKEMKYLKEDEKFHRHTFARNLSRAKVVLAWILNSFQIVKSCFEWESRKLNLIALTIWILFCWFFKPWMLPLLLLIPFLWYRPPKYYLVNWKRYIKGIPIEEHEENHKKEEKQTSLRQKINSLQEMLYTLQSFIGKFASLGESIKNLFNFTVPFLSCLTIFMILIIGFIMFLIPVKYIFMAWGVHKFTRKILRPNRIPNNEILDLLSRVPDDETLLDCEELSLEELEDDDKIN